MCDINVCVCIRGISTMVNVEINSNCSNKNKKRNKNEMATEIYREREHMVYNMICKKQTQLSNRITSVQNGRK